METLKVSGKTNPRKLAGALHAALKKNGGRVAVQAVGAKAVNQAIKAVAIARGMAAPEGANIKVVPGFTDVQIEDQKITALQFNVLWN